MTNLDENVLSHYEPDVYTLDGLLNKLTQVSDGLRGEDAIKALAGLDQFHAGGLPATMELAKRANIEDGMVILDAGCGLGGPSRYLAKSHDAGIIGIDLSPRFVAMARLLTQDANLSDRVTHHVGNLTELGFDDRTFDMVWSQHVSMNIADKARLYRELRRVLKEGGRFAFYDPVAADGYPEVYYPTPWATTAETSFLLTQEEMVATLRDGGLVPLQVEDVTAQAIGWFSQQQTAAASAPVNLGLVLGPRTSEYVGNFVRNLKEGRVRLVMGICTAV